MLENIGNKILACMGRFEGDGESLIITEVSELTCWGKSQFNRKGANKQLTSKGVFLKAKSFPGVRLAAMR